VEAFVDKITSRTAIQPITSQIAVLANQLPSTCSGDPCDRLIGATALAGAFLLVTKDRNIRECKQIKTIW
jgi:PIN domain nuclease of toxin-antitoxin system